MDKIKLIRLDDQQAYTVKSPYVSFSDIFPNVSNISLDNVNSPQMTNFTGLDEALRSINYTQISNEKKIVNVKLTPCKYIGGQLDLSNELGIEVGQAKSPSLSRYTLNIDKAEFTLNGFIRDEITRADLMDEVPIKEYRKGDCVLVVDGTGGTKHYEYKLDLYLDGQLFGKILAIPRDKTGIVLKQNSIQLKLQNNILYESGWIERLQDAIDTLGWELNNITGIDIALDGFDKFQQLASNLMANTWMFKGRSTSQSFHRKGGNLTGMDYGKRSSSKMLTVYNKSIYLKQDHKKYITDFWKANNLKPYNEGGDVYRLELKLRSKAIKKIKGFDWTRLQDGNYLASVMQLCFKNWFDVIQNTGQKNKSREAQIDLIQWDSFNTVHMEKNKTKPSSELYQAKTLIKGMYLRGLRTNNEVLKTEATQMVNEYGLNDWFDWRIGEWIKKLELNAKVIELTPVLSQAAN